MRLVVSEIVSAIELNHDAFYVNEIAGAMDRVRSRVRFEPTLRKKTRVIFQQK
jgi:hypothetical protein